MKHNSLLLLLLLLTSGAPFFQPPHCQGQGVVYASRSEFDAALDSATRITFESLPPTLDDIGVRTITDQGATFTSADSRLFVTTPNRPPGVYPIPGMGQYLWSFDSSFPVGIQLPAGNNAFSADFSGGLVPNTSYTATLTISLANSQSYTHRFTIDQGSWTFLGFIFPQPITSLVYADGAGLHEQMLDTVSYGVSTVPEPPGTLLLSFGLAPIAGRFLKRGQ